MGRLYCTGKGIETSGGWEFGYTSYKELHIKALSMNFSNASLFKCVGLSDKYLLLVAEGLVHKYSSNRRFRK